MLVIAIIIHNYNNQSHVVIVWITSQSKTKTYMSYINGFVFEREKNYNTIGRVSRSKHKLYTLILKIMYFSIYFQTGQSLYAVIFYLHRYSKQKVRFLFIHLFYYFHLLYQIYTQCKQYTHKYIQLHIYAICPWRIPVFILNLGFMQVESFQVSIFSWLRMMVVITSSDLDYGVIFGPIVVQPSILNPSCLIGLMTEDTRNDSSDTRLSVSGPVILLDFLKCVETSDKCYSFHNFNSYLISIIYVLQKHNLPPIFQNVCKYLHVIRTSCTIYMGFSE